MLLKRLEKIVSKRFNQQDKQTKTFDLEKTINLLVSYNHKKHQTNQKSLKAFGEVVEIDGCDHLWIPTLNKINIVLIVDSCGYLISAGVDWQETNKAYIQAISNMVKQYGLPKLIKSDKCTSLIYNNEYETKITKPLRILGVDFDCKSYPQHKTHIENV